MKIYKSYLFRTKDPIIDHLRTAIKDARVTYTEISNRSGVSPGTLTNWFSGPTQRPQFACTMAVARAIGYDLVLVKRETNGRTRVVRTLARRQTDHDT